MEEDVKNELIRIEQILLLKSGQYVFMTDLANVNVLLHYHKEIINLAQMYRVTLLFHKPNHTDTEVR